MDGLKQKVLELFLKNRRTFDQFQYTVPAADSFPYQWLWDSCFHAIILTHFNCQDAKKELLSLVSKQFENGLIPHMIYWEKGKVINISWGKDHTSSITQPPMLAYAVWQIFCKDKDINFLESIYANLYHYYRYLLSERDPRGHHLVGIINPDESGEDNSSRFDICLDLPPQHDINENFQKRLDLVEKNKICKFDAPLCMKNFFWVKDVPFNAILVESLIALANIASKIGKSDDAYFFSQQALLVKDAMRILMFEDGLFWSTYGKDYKKIKVKTWAIFAPLFAKIYSAEEAKQLVERYLLNPSEFALPYIVPTVSKSEASFNPQGYWRGPVWIATNWFIYKGLLNYGFEDLAKKVLDMTLALLEKSGFREQFDPITGEGLGAKDFTWGGLVVDMMEGNC